MKYLFAIILALISMQSFAQVEQEFRIDSLESDRWYFVTSKIYTDESGDKQVQEYRRFFSIKDSVISYGIRVRESIQADSAAAQLTLVQADSAKARINAVLDTWDAIGGGGFRSVIPAKIPIQEAIELPKPKKLKATKKRRKKQ